MIGTGAKLLGPIIIGDNVKVGANSVVVNNVPPHSVVVGVPGRITSRKGEKIASIDLRHGDLPDPISIIVEKLNTRISELEKQVFHKSEQNKDDLQVYYGTYGGGI